MNIALSLKQLRVLARVLIFNLVGYLGAPIPPLLFTYLYFVISVHKILQDKDFTSMFGRYWKIYRAHKIVYTSTRGSFSKMIALQGKGKHVFYGLLAVLWENYYLSKMTILGQVGTCYKLLNLRTYGLTGTKRDLETLDGPIGTRWKLLETRNGPPKNLMCVLVQKSTNLTTIWSF